ncbi:MAG: HAD-IIA family hydrolase [Bacteroidota bacterium]
MQIIPFPELLSTYRAIFFDSYGVLRNYNGIIPGAEETIAILRKKDMPFLVLTNNAARSPQQAADRLAQYGLSGIRAAEIITSGSTTRRFLELKVKSGKVAYLGTPESADYVLGNCFDSIPVAEVNSAVLAQIKAVAFLDDEGYDLNSDLSKLVNILRQRAVPVVVANTDLLYPVSGSEVAVATGSIAKLIELVLGKKFIKFGKPSAPMFQLGFDQMSQLLPDLRPNEILMVGDTLQTDILGGNKFGLDTALVLSGNTREKTVEYEISRTGIVPDFICRSIGQ